MEQIRDFILHLLYLLPLPMTQGTVLQTLLMLVVIFVAVGLIELLLRLLFVQTLPRLLSKVKALEFADNATLHYVLRSLIRIFTVRLFVSLLPVSFPQPEHVFRVILTTVASIYIVFLIVGIFSRLISSLRHWMLTSSKYRNNPMVNLLEVIRLLVLFVAGLYLVSLLFSVDMNKVFGSLAALSAVLLLVFKDTIMGVVASIQLASNDMLRVGDWITVPKYEVDGNVLDISLTTVKIKNFDNTISTIPPYSLITETFKNWRFMEQSGGRKMARAVNIDLKSIKFVDESFIQKLSTLPLEKSYVDEAVRTLSSQVSTRMTNMDLLRSYAQVYLSHQEAVHPSFSCLVHTLAPSDSGLPLELYFFSKATGWAEYEAVSGDIFNHLIALIPYFDLAVFQKVSGYDILHTSSTRPIATQE